MFPHLIASGPCWAFILAAACGFVVGVILHFFFRGPTWIAESD